MRPATILAGILAVVPAAAQNTLTMPNGATNSGPSSVVIRGPLPDILFTEMQLGQNGARAALYLASAPTGETFGVWGQSASANGTGVIGIASANSGPCVGVKGISSSNEGYAGYFQGRAFVSSSIGVQVQSPEAPIHAAGTILSERLGGFAEFRGRRANGSASSPLPLNGNQFMMVLSGQGHDGTAYATGAQIVAVSEQPWDSTSHGTRLAFYTVENDSTSVLERMRIAANGFVGIGTTVPSQRLHVVGNICATGSVGTCSDARFKKNVGPIPNALQQLDRLQGVSFEWRRDDYPDHQFADGKQIGFIAQEVARVLPHLVARGTDGSLSLDYARLTPVIVEALREFRAEAEFKLGNRDQRLARLERENALLRDRLAMLESRLTQIAGDE